MNRLFVLLFLLVFGSCTRIYFKEQSELSLETHLTNTVFVRINNFEDIPKNIRNSFFVFEQSDWRRISDEKGKLDYIPIYWIEEVAISEDQETYLVFYKIRGSAIFNEIALLEVKDKKLVVYNTQNLPFKIKGLKEMGFNLLD